MTIPATARTTRSNRSTRSAVWLPFALIALVVVPVVFGSLRLIELAGGPQLMPVGPVVFGLSELTTDLSLGAGWAINLAVAEYVIRRHANRGTVSRRTIAATAKVRV